MTTSIKTDIVTTDYKDFEQDYNLVEKRVSQIKPGDIIKREGRFQSVTKISCIPNPTKISVTEWIKIDTPYSGYSYPKYKVIWVDTPKI